MLEFAQIIWFFLTVWGLAYVTSWSKAGAIVRVFTDQVPVIKDLVRCPACIGWWIGGSLALGGLGPEGLWDATISGDVAGVCACAFAACGVNRIIAGGSIDATEGAEDGEEQ